MRTKQTVMEEIQKKADAIRAASAITNAAAITKAVQDFPGLYAEYCAAPVDAPQPAAPRETVAMLAASVLEKRAVAIKKARNLSDYDSYCAALDENQKLVKAARNPQFASQFVDELV